jgi:hypothetical protein
MEMAYASAPSRYTRRDRALKGDAVERTRSLIEIVRPNFSHQYLPARIASIWAFNWLNELASNAVEDGEVLFRWLFGEMLMAEDDDLRYLLSWAMSSFEPFSIPSLALKSLNPAAEEFVVSSWTQGDVLYALQAKRTALIVAYYLEMMPAAEIIAKSKALPHSFDRHLEDIVTLLTPKGAADSNSVGENS